MANKFAFVFPGQGSQSVGMLADLANEYAIVEQTFHQASQALDYDLWQLVQDGPAEKLNQTIHTQPVLLTASVAVWLIWQQRRGDKPNFLAGHSLGEYTALVCADALEFNCAVKLVAERARLMQAAVAVDAGAMAAIIGLDNKKVTDICAEVAQNDTVEPVNFNAIGQVVVAGDKVAVNRALLKAKEEGAKIAKLLPVSVPSHCALMQPAAEKLATYLLDINIGKPNIPIINNVDVAVYDNPDKIKQALVRQLYSPVRWVETIQSLAENGCEVIYECGPGKVLTGLIKRIDKNLKPYTLYEPNSLEQALSE